MNIGLIIAASHRDGLMMRERANIDRICRPARRFELTTFGRPRQRQPALTPAAAFHIKTRRRRVAASPRAEIITGMREDASAEMALAG